MTRPPLTAPRNGATPPIYKGGVLYVEGAAVLLNTTTKAIRSKVARGLLPYRRLGHRIVFVRAELEAFIATLPGVTLDEARANLALRNGDLVRR